MVLLGCGDYAIETVELATGYQFTIDKGLHITYNRKVLGILHFDGDGAEVLLTMCLDGYSHYKLNSFWDAVEHGKKLLETLI